MRRQPRRLRSRFRANYFRGKNLSWIGFSEDNGIYRMGNIRRQRRSIWQRVEDNTFQLENDHCIAHAHEVLHARGVPVGEANATVTRSATNCLGIIRAMNTDTGFIQAYPENADEIVRAGREIVIIFSAHA